MDVSIPHYSCSCWLSFWKWAWILGNPQATTDGEVRWLRLLTQSRLPPYQCQVYTRCLTTFICCGCAYGCVHTTLYLYGKKTMPNFWLSISLLNSYIVVPEFIVASTIRRQKIRVGNWEIKPSSIFFNLLRGYEKGIFSKNDVGISITIPLLQTPQSDDKSSSVDRKMPSLSPNLSWKLNTAAPQTNTTW